MAHDLAARIRNVTAVLGPTNTGKTHLAIERMLGHESGMIGLPLRLLAREVYDKIKIRVGADKVALITGEEKIKPEGARYWVTTVEAMPRDVTVDFLAIDEIQLCGDPERGHVFTDRLLHARGKSETLLLGAQTMREAIEDVVPGANFISRPRLSKLQYSGQKKLTRLPARTAIVAFSAAEVYAVAELIRRQRGGAAVVLGALSPRTRNAQVALYQAGDVEFLVATDAIGMGLNLDVDHVAFSGLRKFDGQNHRRLTAGEMAQIAGRAGRHMNDGTFGVTGSADPLENDLVERLETHAFDSVRVLQWRNRNLDFGSADRLRDSLRDIPNAPRMTRARSSDDVIALEAVMRDSEVMHYASGGPAAVAKLWDVCQIPDYRKVSEQAHAELAGSIYKFLLGPQERIPEDWFTKQVAFADRTDGDIDTLANRIAHIRTWTFVANRPDWLRDPGHWQSRTREIEDNLSDALHERLTQRFVDRRTSALMKGMRDKDELTADIAADGSITVENHFVGKLEGFRFTLDPSVESAEGKATRNAAAQVLSRELGLKARRVAAANAEAFKLTRNGRIKWREEDVAKVEAGDDILAPVATVLADDHLSAADREKVQARLDAWLKELIADKLKPLIEMQAAEDIAGLARGIAFQMREGLGVLKREAVAADITALDQDSRAQLRKYGVRFGAFNIFIPPLLKPAPAELAATLWALKHGAANAVSLDTPPALPRAGLTSVTTDPAVPEALYRANGYHLCGPRAVRLDILERLADLIRPLLAWRTKPDTATEPPKGSTGDGGFRTTDDMMSILGCSGEELATVLSALGFRLERRPVKVTSPAAVTPAPQPSVEPALDLVEAAAAQTPGPAAEAAPADDQVTAAPGVEAAVSADQAEPKVDVIQEPVFEEIWRPKRHQRPEHRGDQRTDQQRSQPNKPRDNNRRDGWKRPAHGQPPSQPAAEAAAASAGQHTPAEIAGSDEERQAKRDGQRGRDRNTNSNTGPRPERQHERQHGGPRRDKPFDARGDNRGDSKGRGDRDRPRKSETPGVTSAAPRNDRRSAAADPDSPFAALAALKEAMAKRAQSPQ